MIRQRNPRSPRILSVRPITKEDLLLLHQRAGRPQLQVLRESHHTIARLAASGLSNTEISVATGYSMCRISVLLHDPSMVELIAKYRGMITENWRNAEDVYLQTVLANRNRAELEIADTMSELAEKGERLSVRELLAISRDAADRTGFGKVQKNLNVNVDFAAKLEAARKRSDGVQLEARVVRESA